MRPGQEDKGYVIKVEDAFYDGHGAFVDEYPDAHIYRRRPSQKVIRHAFEAALESGYNGSYVNVIRDYGFDSELIDAVAFDVASPAPLTSVSVRRREMTNHMVDRLQTHTCGGTILSGGSGEQAHLYCDRCRAYTYDLDGAVPDGTDQTANRAAWDAGDSESPAAD